MPPSPPPTVHADKKSPADKTLPADASESAPPPAAEEMVKGTSPSIDEEEQEAAVADVGFLQGKTFAQKMHSLLDMPDYSSIISWNDAGTAVIIHDVDAFISTVMPAYFQHAQFGSFTRRMRRWGFRVANHRSTSSTSSEQGQSTAMQFSCEHFLRDQPDVCLMMKDERQSKKKFQFLDRHVRLADGVESNQGSSAGGIVHYPSTPASRSAQLKAEIKPPIPVYYPPSSSNLNTANNQLESQPQSEMPYTIPNTTTDAGFNATNHGYLHTYSQQAQMPSMISPYQHSFHNAMSMNMMMPTPNLSRAHYPSYGHGVPPPPPSGVGFGISPPAFQYPAPEGYYPYPQQQPHQQVHQQQQIQQQMPQQIQQQQQQHIMSMMDARASAAASASTALLLSSSSEETPGLEFLPTKTSPDTKGQSKVDTEEKTSTKDRIEIDVSGGGGRKEEEEEE